MKKSIIACSLLLSVVATSVASEKKPLPLKKIEVTTIKNVSPLSIAVAKGDYDTTASFLEYGADSNQKSVGSGMTPIMYAARYNNVKLLKLLISKGADATVTSKIGYTALGYAKLSNATEAVAFLKSL
ncbi:MAG: ankyrin repeat domain-containing protein [Cellulophaga sp.]|uniref:ankyrin repeat domain-containing protein n=1 Tax=unclassified Cellulophaga TaxID=2634405 RepID=UPI0026E2716C|nr:MULTISPECIES: ankyrin repeat domain-containing protein [unclassified Cellulophaga]MDO6492978.1 ankyrin repeat domain-containing protein [Cellulophaga sp. 2_MG-2023]MDO6496204.1 ankyrin repeat domain-containing protein [Cellulophaga sp. 3_MG-2023]